MRARTGAHPWHETDGTFCERKAIRLAENDLRFSLRCVIVQEAADTQVLLRRQADARTRRRTMPLATAGGDASRPSSHPLPVTGQQMRLERLRILRVNEDGAGCTAELHPRAGLAAARVGAERPCPLAENSTAAFRRYSGDVGRTARVKRAFARVRGRPRSARPGDAHQDCSASPPAQAGGGAPVPGCGLPAALPPRAEEVVTAPELQIRRREGSPVPWRASAP